MKINHLTRPCFPLLLLSLVQFNHSASAQGSLTPPGAPGPTMKSLDQVEPRVPISSVPFTINLPGSYYLTTNLNSSGGGYGIIIANNSVTIDLNGFTVNGAGIGYIGVYVSGNRTNITIRNGNLNNWTSYGIDARTCNAGIFENLQLGQNNDAGLACGSRGRVQDCVSMFNTLDGFYVGGDTVVKNCIAEGNGQDGMNISASGCRAEDNHLLRNVRYGLYVPNGGNLVIRNSAQGNGTNFNIFSFNVYGPTNSSPGVITNLNPWANFSY